MKILKLVLIGGFLFGALASKAQIQKGNYMVGVGVADINLGLGSNGNTSFFINPNVGYFLADNLVIAVNPSFRYASFKDNDGIVNLGLGVLARYYFGQTNIGGTGFERGRFFAEATIGGYKALKYDGLPVNYGLGVGYAYFINTNVALEAKLNYTRINNGSELSNYQNLDFGIGFQIHLPKCKK